MIKNVNFNRNYVTRIGSSCRMSSLTNCLYNFGIDIDESIIFFLYDGFKLLYQLNEKINITSNETESIQLFLKKNNIIENVISEISLTTLLKYLEKSIKDNIAIRCKLSTDVLEYSNIFQINKANVHYIEIIGYDYEKKAFLISDGFVPEYPLKKFQGLISAEKFINVNNNYYIFDYVSLENYRKVYKPNKSIGLLREKIIQSLQNYFSTAQGQEALINFSEDILILKPLWGESFAKNLYDLISQIKTHGIANRALFLKKALLIIGINDSDIINELDNLYKSWYGFSLLLLKFCISDGENPETIKSKLDKIIKQETTLFNKVLLNIYQL